jgi:3-oxoacyl-[acyl-carrier protein] reductase
MSPLSGKTALVTGGSRGIGRAICLALAEGGAEVIFTYLENRVAADQTLTLLDSVGRSGRALPMDVRDPQSIQRTFETIIAQAGGIDVLVNNAGINKPTDFDQISVTDWDEIMAVNLRGPFLCSQMALQSMKTRGGGSIVHIGSVSGQYGGPRTAHYAASKAGLISLGQVIARYGAKDSVRSNTVAAGMIESDMAATAITHPAVQSAVEGVLLKRLGTTAEVARAVVFLASDASSYVTGQTLNVNGGLYF